MVYCSNPELGVLRITRPDEFRTKIRVALDAHQGSVLCAARALGVGRSTLFRWIKADPSLRLPADPPAPLTLPVSFVKDPADEPPHR